MRIILLIMLVLTMRAAVAADVHVVPIEIRDYFKANGCSEVLDYYSESRVIDKPYLYGAISLAGGVKSNNDYSFIAWCKSLGGNFDNQYVLVGRLDGAVWPGGCKFPIGGFDYPGGIGIARKKISLGAFTDFSYRKVRGGSIVGAVISSERDGLVYEVFCHRGTWGVLPR